MNEFMHSVEIAELDQHPMHRPQVVEWLYAQWEESTRDEFDEAIRTRSGCPPTLIAIDHDQPIGVLAYTLFTMKTRTTEDMWINAVYVATSWRGRGVGSRLVTEGVHAAKAFGRSTIYVNTDVPRFYERNGWTRFRYNQETSMHVLQFHFD